MWLVAAATGRIGWTLFHDHPKCQSVIVFNQQQQQQRGIVLVCCGRECALDVNDKNICE